MKIVDWALTRFQNLLLAYVAVIGMVSGIGYLLYRLGENTSSALKLALIVLAYLGTGLAIGAMVAVSLKLIMKIGSLSLFGLSWFGLIAIVPYGVWTVHSIVAEAAGSLETLGTSESEQIDDCPKNSYRYRFVFEDEDNDGWGECQKREWNRPSGYVARRTPSLLPRTDSSTDYDPYGDRDAYDDAMEECCQHTGDEDYSDDPNWSPYHNGREYINDPDDVWGDGR